MLKWLMNTKEISLAVLVNAKAKAVVGGGGGGGGIIQKGYWPIPFSADEALQVSELLLSKPVVYKDREFRELASVSLSIGFPYG